MKKFMSGLIALAMLNLVFVSCEQKDTETPPEIPPYESMFTDFSEFTVNESSKSANGSRLKSTEEETMINYGFSALEVGFFNLVLGVTLVVPVTAFKASFAHKPNFLGDATWQWTYDVSGFAKTYVARLVGQVRSEDILWEMYLSVEGIGGHPEFLWFQGTSDLDGHGGQWTLNHSHQFQEPVLQIDWKSDGEKVGEIRYTYVREENNAGEPEKGNGNYIQAGLVEEDLNAYYDIHIYNESQGGFIDVNIEWSTTEYNGRVKCPEFFKDNGEWHCWDSYGYDIVCEN